MKKLYVIIGSILLITLIGFGTVFLMNSLKAPKLNTQPSDSKQATPSASDLYSQAQAAAKNGNIDQAKQLYQESKTEYSKIKTDESAERINDIDTQLHTLDTQQKYKEMETKNDKTPLVPSGQ